MRCTLVGSATGSTSCQFYRELSIVRSKTEEFVLLSFWYRRRATDKLKLQLFYAGGVGKVCSIQPSSTSRIMLMTRCANFVLCLCRHILVKSYLCLKRSLTYRSKTAYYRFRCPHLLTWGAKENDELRVILLGPLMRLLLAIYTVGRSYYGYYAASAVLRCAVWSGVYKSCVRRYRGISRSVFS